MVTSWTDSFYPLDGKRSVGEIIVAKQEAKLCRFGWVSNVSFLEGFSSQDCMHDRDVREFQKSLDSQYNRWSADKSNPETWTTSCRGGNRTGREEAWLGSDELRRDKESQGTWHDSPWQCPHRLEAKNVESTWRWNAHD